MLAARPGSSRPGPPAAVDSTVSGGQTQAPDGAVLPPSQPTRAHRAVRALDARTISSRPSPCPSSCSPYGSPRMRSPSAAPRPVRVPRTAIGRRRTDRFRWIPSMSARPIQRAERTFPVDRRRPSGTEACTVLGRGKLRRATPVPGLPEGGESDLVHTSPPPSGVHADQGGCGLLHDHRSCVRAPHLHSRGRTSTDQQERSPSFAQVSAFLFLFAEAWTLDPPQRFAQSRDCPRPVIHPLFRHH